MRTYINCIVNMETVLNQNKLMLDLAKKKLGDGIYRHEMFVNEHGELIIQTFLEYKEIK